MKTKFNLSKTSDADALFCNISELLFDLENQIGSPELLEQNITEMFEAASSLNPAETETFRMYLNFFKDIKELLREDEKNFYDYKYELRSYEDGRFVIDETEGVKYFDHPYHQDYFKQNNTEKKCITVTKSI
jgi:hypothetical protein